MVCSTCGKIAICTQEKEVIHNDVLNCSNGCGSNLERDGGEPMVQHQKPQLPTISILPICTAMEMSDPSPELMPLMRHFGPA